MSIRNALVGIAISAIFLTGMAPGTGSWLVPAAMAQDQPGDPTGGAGTSGSKPAPSAAPMVQPISGPTSINLPTAAPPTASKPVQKAPTVAFKPNGKTPAAPAADQDPNVLQQQLVKLHDLADSVMGLLPTILEPLEVSAMLILLIGYTVHYRRRTMRNKAQAELEKSAPAPEFGDPDPKVFRTWEPGQAPNSTET